MRIWEFTDKKEAPADLVREQDFILRVRRMYRLGMPCLVINFMLTAIEALAKDIVALDIAQKKLQEFAKQTGAAYYEMSNGDSFVVWERVSESRSLSNRAVDFALSEHKNNTNLFLMTFKMPENYGLLRERTNDYIEGARARKTIGESVGRVDDARGPLTAKNVDQISQILLDIEVRRFGRAQPIYRDHKTSWEMLAEEYFISFEDLRREHFPKLDIAKSEHFFFAICTLLDQRLLGSLTTSFSSISGRAINLNLSIASIMGSVFAQFVHSVPRDQRRLIGFELHSGDLFQDFGLTLSAIDTLKREGFRVILDSVAPNMIGYVDFNKFTVDSIKINVTKDNIAYFSDPAVLDGVKQLPSDKLLFFRCDNPRALAIGREIGVAKYQGWLIDDLASKNAKN